MFLSFILCLKLWLYISFNYVQSRPACKLRNMNFFTTVQGRSDPHTLLDFFRMENGSLLLTGVDLHHLLLLVCRRTNFRFLGVTLEKRHLDKMLI